MHFWFLQRTGLAAITPIKNHLCSPACLRDIKENGEKWAPVMIFTVRPPHIPGAMPNLLQGNFLPHIRKHWAVSTGSGGVELEFTWSKICCLPAFCRSPSWNISYWFNQLYLLQRILSDELVTLHRLPQSSNGSHSGLKFSCFVQQSKDYFTCMVRHVAEEFLCAGCWISTGLAPS